MAYDEQLAVHVHALLNGQQALVEEKMFAGAGIEEKGIRS
jgi:hypothetical protein